MASNKISNGFWLKLVSVPLLMFAFAYAMVPIYDVLCDLTGFAGKTGRISSYEANAAVIDETRRVKVEFLTMTSGDFNIDFKPEISSLEVIPGKVYQTNFIVNNKSKQTIVGQAVPSVAPPSAALQFKKIECFCFTKQTFKPETKVVMPVSFIVQTNLDASVKDITLSYNFFKIKG